MRRVVLIVGGLLLALGALAPAAVAQINFYQPPTTTYNGGTYSTLPGSSSGIVNGPKVAPAGCFDTPFTGFLTSSAIQIIINQLPPFAKLTNADGTLVIRVCIHIGGSAQGRLSLAAVGLHLAAAAPTIVIDGVSYPAHYGINTLTATGTGSNGGPRTVTVTFEIVESSGGALGRTGVRIAGFTVVGLAMIAAGFALVGVNRRRNGSTPQA